MPRLTNSEVTWSLAPVSAFGKLSGSAEERFLEAFDEGLARLRARVAEAVGETVGRAASSQERVRAGLVALLGFFDDEPHWGRVLIEEAPFGETGALERRARLFEVLGELLKERGGNEIASCEPSPQVICELLAGGVFSVIRARMLDGDDRPLVELAPTLMSFVEPPYLGEDAARAELIGGPAFVERTLARGLGLPIRATYRTARVLRAITVSPHASNREIANAAGVSDEGQTSKLLSRLKRRGLIENVGRGAAYGERNAWVLTPAGRRLASLSGCSLTASPWVSARSPARSASDV